MRLTDKLSLTLLLIFGGLMTSGALYFDTYWHPEGDFQSIRTWRFLLITAFFALCALGLIAGLWFSRRFQSECAAFGAEARRQILTPGRLRLSVSSELQEAAGGVNELLTALQDNLDELEIQLRNDESVLNAMSEPVIAVDRSGRVTLANTAAVKLFRFPAYPVGRELNELIRNSAIQDFFQALLHNSSPGTTETQEIRFYSEPSEPPRILQLNGGTLFDRDRRKTAALAVLNDVTRLRQMEAVQRDFVSSVSHELRTPLTVIRSTAESLAEEGALNDPSLQNLLAPLIRNAGRLDAIITDLLALAKAENLSETQALHRENLNVSEAVEHALLSCSPRILEKNATIVTHIGKMLQLYANPALLEQALTNYIDNALKYSAHHQTVTITAETADGGVLFSVADEGPGIASEHLPRLFDRFYRVDKGRSRQSGGTGLGLAIVRFIAKAHGGRTSVESTVGKGSVFRIWFPSGETSPEAKT